MTADPPRSKNRIHASTFILITMFLDAMGIGIIIPVTPDLIQELSIENLGQAAIIGGYLSAIYAVMQFLCSPTLGNLSDRFGRRPVILFSLFALGIDYIIMGFAPTLLVLFIGRLLAGIAGATHSTANAYMADISSPEDRTKNFGLVGAAFGLGFIAGPVIGGMVAEFGTRAPFFAAAALVGLNFLYGMFVLPETLSQDKRRDFLWKRANPVGAVMQAFKIPGMLMFFAAFFLYQLSNMVYPSVWAYYTKENFSWTAAQVGISLGAFGAMYALVQGGVIRLILAKLRESHTAVLGLVITVIGMLIMVFIDEGWMIYAVLPLTALGGVVVPALSGVMSRSVSEDAQGELQGALSSIMGITLIISPVMMTQIFGFFTSASSSVYLPGGVFGVSAVIAMLSGIPLFFALRQTRRSK